LKEEELRKDGEILTKPNPWGINQLKKLLPACERYILIGDSEDDVISAFNAKINAILFKNDNIDISIYPNLIMKMFDWNDLFVILKKN
jgi:phosphoglycolate phosphatase-like HAD superfamily hydrolase